MKKTTVFVCDMRIANYLFSGKRISKNTKEFLRDEMFSAESFNLEIKNKIIDSSAMNENLVIFLNGEQESNVFRNSVKPCEYLSQKLVDIENCSYEELKKKAKALGKKLFIIGAFAKKEDAFMAYEEWWECKKENKIKTKKQEKVKN